VATLAIHGPEVVAAAEAIADDLAHGRVIGKELGDRHVSGLRRRSPTTVSTRARNRFLGF
jgi:hypothetical protein